MEELGQTLPSPYLSFDRVCYSVNGRTILDNLTFDVEAGETLVLLGRSGSGKTTALRLINRLLDLSSGRILIEGKDTAEVDPIELRRRIGYVIQDFGLMPHWTLEENVSMVLRLLGWPLEKRQERAGKLLAQVGLDGEGIRKRYPRNLSGGQQQRVGVARALAAEPSLLLFDEPFGALDPVTRHEMQQQFLKLRDEYHVTSVFVTHDLMEALAIATRIGVLNQGKLETWVRPQEFPSVQTPMAKAFLETLPPGFLDKLAKAAK